MTGRARRRLLIADEGLKRETGHWYEYDKAVVELHRGTDVDVTVAAHRDVRPEITDELNAQPVFAYTNWDHIYDSPRALIRYLGIARHNTRTYRALTSFVDRHPPFDCIFVPTTTIYHLAGLNAFARRSRSRRFSRLVIFIRNNAGIYAPEATTPTFRRSTGVLRRVLQAFEPQVRAGLVEFATDSARLAREYHLLAGTEMTVFPSPRVAPRVRDQRDAGKQGVTMTLLGPPRYEKGVDVLQDAILQVRQRWPRLDIRFFLQWNGQVLGPDGTEIVPLPELMRDDRVEYHLRELDSAEYERRLYQSDCVILPYRRESYYGRISGIAVEAATAGIPVIYSHDTWVADAIQGYGAGAGFPDGDAGALAETIHAVAVGIDRYAAAGTARAAAAREYHSRERFLSALWGGHGSPCVSPRA